MLDAIKHLLWDVDREALDPVKHKKFIIERVLKYGTPKEVVWLLARYAEADIIAVIKSSRNLDRKTATYWSVHYNIPADEIRCLQMPLIISCCY
jgi:Family of unknown function (DUF6922)